MKNLLYTKISICFLGTVVLFWGCTAVNKSFGADKQKFAKEFVIRNGFSSINKKIKRGDAVTIAYLGGSITEAGNGWRSKTQQWLEKHYPNMQFKEVMAGIGGTASDFGAYRVKEHVLKFNPDLVFVEFAVNDRERAYNDIIKSMEGIVRQIKQTRPGTDIIFIYTLSNTEDMRGVYDRGGIPNSVKAMEAVASYYGIPSVNLAWSVLKKINEGTLSFTKSENSNVPAFSGDGVHPNEYGHIIYADIIKEALSNLLIKKGAVTRTVKAAMDKDNLQYVEMVSPDNIRIKRIGNWSLSDTMFNGAFKNFVPFICSTSDTASRMEMEFEGTGFGLADILGPTSSAVKIILDNKVYKKIRFDPWSTYNRINYFLISGLAPGKHRVRLMLDSSGLNKRAIIKDTNFKNFDEHSLYIGYILISK